MIICCDKAQLRRFKQRAARNFPKEYMEVLFGESSPSGYAIKHFVSPPQVSTRGWVEPSGSDEEYDAFVASVEGSTGLEFLGSIHTHTNGVEHPSYTDHEGANECEEQIFAIDTVTKGKNGRYTHAINFWLPQQPVESVVLV